MFTCACCNKDQDLTEICELPCACLLCKSCVIEHVDRNTSAITADAAHQGRIIAPCPTCATPLYPSHLQAISPSRFVHWESQLSHALLCSQNLSQCPYPDCGAWIETVGRTPPPRPSAPPAKRPHSPRPDPDDVVIIDDSDEEAAGDPAAAAKQHFDLHRYRCGLCKRDFCAECNTRPYHKGHTCRQWRAPKCQYCTAKVLHRGDLRNPFPPLRALRRQLSAAGLEIYWCIERADCQFVYERLRGTCTAAACREKLQGACLKRLTCGHPCHGICDESPCLRCIEPTCQGSSAGASSSSAPPRPPPPDACFFCWEPLPSSPCIELTCGHICHLHCARQRLLSGYPGPGISFQFLYCPLCGTGDGGGGGSATQQATAPVHLDHPALQKELRPHLDLRQRVVEVAKVRVRVELEVAREEELQPGGKFEGKPADFALSKFIFFRCHRCSKPYFGGKRECGDNNEGGEFNEEELICGECSASVHGTKCPRHGTSFIEWKCKYCCNISSWFCFGTTHFCDPCHRRARDVRNQPCDPTTCALKGAHPPAGTEFCLGCGLCRRADVV